MNIERGDYIRNMRKQLGLSQEQLARRVGVSQVTISEWERGVAYPSKIRELAEALGVGVEKFASELAFRTVFDDPVEQAINLQDRLQPEARKALLTVYRLMLKGSTDPAA